MKYAADVPGPSRVCGVFPSRGFVSTLGPTSCRVLGGLGVAVLSTSQGLMSDREARKRRVGGEFLATSGDPGAAR